MTDTVKTYASKSNANRAAKAFVAKSEEELNYTLVEHNGEWTYVVSAPVVEAPEEEEAVEEPKPVVKKDVRLRNSTHGGVCAQVWAICFDRPEASRKEILEICFKSGIADNTAKTQYQRWKNRVPGDMGPGGGEDEEGDFEVEAEDEDDQ